MKPLLFLLLLAFATVDAAAQTRRAPSNLKPVSSAVPEIRIRLTGSTTTTVTSGGGGTSNGMVLSEHVQTNDWNPTHGILSQLSLAEAGDNPCAIRGTYWQAPSSTVEDGERTLDFSRGETNYAVSCDNQTGFRHSNAGYSRRSAGRSPSSLNPTAIRGLQVCHNDRDGRNYKLKGLRVFMATINQDGNGEVSPDPGLTSTFERNHCREWSREVTCPSGQVAVGVKVYYHDGRNNRGRNAISNPDRITGLALQCRRVRVG
ncbi:MAG: hypothetical protein Rubg2KO_01230 [Rubricoccaceae bacterium]